MSDVFSAKFSVVGSIPTGNLNEFDLFGDVVDASFDGYSVNDIQINDLVYDEDLLNGSNTRWKVISVVATGPGSIFGSGGATACHLVVIFDDTGVAPLGIGAGTGAICRSSSINSLSEIPSVSAKGIPESLASRIRNIDIRNIIDPLLGSGNGSGSVVSNENDYINNSGSSIVVLTPVRSDSGELNIVDVSIESEVSAIIGVTKQTIADAQSGTVVLNGLVENISTPVLVDNLVYLSKFGGLISTPPDIGVEGFEAGDFVVLIGLITQNTNNPSQKDLLLKIDIKGQL